MSTLTERERESLANYSADLYAELSRMTVKQLRTYANQHRVALGGASVKSAIISEMVGQLRNRRLSEMEG